MYIHGRRSHSMNDARARRWWTKPSSSAVEYSMLDSDVRTSRYCIPFISHQYAHGYDTCLLLQLRIVGSIK